MATAEGEDSAEEETRQALWEEIEIKSRTPETQYEALELIDRHIPHLPLKVCRIVRDLTGADDLLVRELAGQLLVRCSENYPFLTLTETLLNDLREIRENSIAPILTMQEQVRKMQTFLEQAMIPVGELPAITASVEQQIRPMQDAIRQIKLLQIPLSKFDSSWMEKIPSFTPTRSGSTLLLDRMERMEERMERVLEELDRVKAEAEVNRGEYEGLKRMFENLEAELDRSYQYH
ncbi:hypothetical protein [Methanosphaerula subterraneus]|uniref:hypothetical protein n=1 Tax=Methanosphaerula subterraneus TaxID=3350244 RepID=UPI003F824268